MRTCVTLIVSQQAYLNKPDINRYVITARSELRKVLFLAPSVCFLFVHEMSRDWTDLRQIHTEDVFGPTLGRVWRSRSKVKDQDHQRQKRHFRRFWWPACGLCLVKHLTSLASSFSDLSLQWSCSIKHVFKCTPIKPNSITLAGSELVRSWLESDSVMAFGLYQLSDRDALRV